MISSTSREHFGGERTGHYTQDRILGRKNDTCSSLHMVPQQLWSCATACRVSTKSRTLELTDSFHRGSLTLAYGRNGHHELSVVSIHPGHM